MSLYLGNMLPHQQPPDLKSAGSSDNNECHVEGEGASNYLNTTPR